jgi:chromosome segregation ATPase
VSFQGMADALTAAEERIESLEALRDALSYQNQTLLTEFAELCGWFKCETVADVQQGIRDLQEQHDAELVSLRAALASVTTERDKFAEYSRELEADYEKRTTERDLARAALAEKIEWIEAWERKAKQLAAQLAEAQQKIERFQPWFDWREIGEQRQVKIEALEAALAKAQQALARNGLGTQLAEIIEEVEELLSVRELCDPDCEGRCRVCPQTSAEAIRSQLLKIQAGQIELASLKERHV